MAAKITDNLRAVLVPVHPEGWRFIALFVAVTLIAGYLWTPFFGIGGVLSVWCVAFFRDPERETPTRAGLVISSADGVVNLIQPAPPPPELDMGDAPLTRISVFMNVFNVHVNRIPTSGRIVRLAYRPGKFFNASFDKASEHNERQSVMMQTADGRNIAFVQIAGLVARRILCTLNPGQDVQAGERFGMIRFGSRVDIYLPDGVQPAVSVGQKTVAGETVIADLDLATRAGS